MKFARIDMLYLIWMLPLLALVCLYGARRRRRILDRFAFGKSRSAVSADAVSARRGIQWALVLFGLLFGILALSGPRYGFHWEEVEQKGVDIIVALDCSKSMLANDIPPTRLDRAKRKVVDLLGMLKGDRVGLVAFAGTAFLQCPLTIDYQAFYLFLDSLTPDFLPVGGTNLQEALGVAQNSFNPKENSQKAVILITDGENTGPDPSEAIAQAQKAGIKVFTIGVGGETGVPVPGENGGLVKDETGKIVVTRLDEDLLRKIAMETGGIYVRSVAGDMDLVAVYEKEIRGKMEAATVTSGKRQVRKDRFQWFLVLAVAAFLAEGFLPVARNRKTGNLASWVLGGLILFCPLPGYAESAYSQVQQGLGAYEKGDYEAALKHFIDAQLAAPDQPEIYYNIGNTYYKLGDYESARKNYGQALKSQDRDMQQKTRYNLGNTRFRENQLEEAIHDYEEALKLDPEDREARENLELAKKKMEEQKQQQQNPEDQKQDGEQNQPKQEGEQDKEGDPKQKQDKDASDQGKPDQQKTDEESKSGSSGDDEFRPEYGKEMEQPSQENETSGAQPENKDAQGSEKPQPGEVRQEQTPDDLEQQQADRMLNRLKDKPGRALIPAYSPREVEKNW